MLFGRQNLLENYLKKLSIMAIISRSLRENRPLVRAVWQAANSCEFFPVLHELSSLSNVDP
jgi:hypothetical protein